MKYKTKRLCYGQKIGTYRARTSASSKKSTREDWLEFNRRRKRRPALYSAQLGVTCLPLHPTPKAAQK